MSSRTTTILRLTGLALFVGALFFVGTRPSVAPYFELAFLRETTAEAGLLGVGLFLGLWILSYLMQLPGIVFILAAILGWGSLEGSFISFVGLTLATSVSFWVLRGIGGSPLAEFDSEWLERALDKLDERPVRTVALVRVVFLVNPLVNLSLVLTDVRFRDYLLGSMIGFVAPLAAIALATDTVLRFVVA